jgi:hypothetical protein
MIQREAAKGNHVGFFGAVRLLMPSIYEVASVIYKGSENQKTTKLLKELRIETPSLAIEMFRHALLHGAVPRSVIYRGKSITWGISTGGIGHIFKHNHVMIDVKNIYEDLVALIEKKITEDRGQKVYLEVGIQIRSKAKDEIKQEIVALT